MGASRREPFCEARTVELPALTLELRCERIPAGETIRDTEEKRQERRSAVFLEEWGDEPTIAEWRERR